jgi:hypothetical protein
MYRTLLDSLQHLCPSTETECCHSPRLVVNQQNIFMRNFNVSELYSLLIASNCIKTAEISTGKFCFFPPIYKAWYPTDDPSSYPVVSTVAPVSLSMDARNFKKLLKNSFIEQAVLLPKDVYRQRRAVTTTEALYLLDFFVTRDCFIATLCMYP